MQPNIARSAKAIPGLSPAHSADLRIFRGGRDGERWRGFLRKCAGAAWEHRSREEEDQSPGVTEQALNMIQRQPLPCINRDFEVQAKCERTVPPPVRRQLPEPSGAGRESPACAGGGKWRDKKVGPLREGPYLKSKLAALPGCWPDDSVLPASFFPALLQSGHEGA